MVFRAADYPPHWKELRKACLERDKHQCVKCSVPNGSIGAWDKNGRWHHDSEIARMSFLLGHNLFGSYPRMRRIVLTCHHTCRNKQCDDLSHLEALCQRCHLIEEHVTAKKGRQRKRIERLANAAQHMNEGSSHDGTGN